MKDFGSDKGSTRDTRISATRSRRQNNAEVRLAAVAGPTIGLLFGALAMPAAAYTPTTKLGSLGLNENQQRSGDAVQIVCGQFASGSITPANSAQQDLFDRCRSMVHTANDISGTGPSADSLGLGQVDLGNTVMTVATEELSATKSMANEIASNQNNTTFARLQAVRAGNRFGLAGAGFDQFGKMAKLDPSDERYTAARGGAAGDELTNDWGFFFNANGGTGDRDKTENENEFDYDSWGFDVGADYRFNPNFVAGAVISYGSDDIDFSSVKTSPGVPSLPGGGIESDAWGVAFYGTYFKDNFYVDGLVGYTRTDYDIDRKILLFDANNPGQTVSRTAKGDTDSDGYTLSLGGGFDMQNGSLNYGPYGRLTYRKTDIDSYSESRALGLNLDVASQEWTSVTSVLGVRASYSNSTSWGIIVPQGRVGWVHEFDNDSERFTAVYSNDPGRNKLINITDDPDRDYFELGFSVSAVLSGGIQAFFDYETLLGLNKVTDHAFTLGIRAEY
jgi:outer membrane autotransporter protein